MIWLLLASVAEFSSSMLVTVVHVGAVRMFVLDRLVGVDMAVCADDRAVVDMCVMAIVVRVRVVMGHAGVAVAVSVPLGRVQPHRDREQRGRTGDGERRASIAQRKGEHRADERPEGEQ